MPVEITGELPKLVDQAVKDALHKALDPRLQFFRVDVSWPHAELIVDIREPFGRRLKFNHPSEAEIARELYSTIMAIADEKCGPIADK